MNQYTTVGGEPLSYDANGNLTSMPGLMLQYDSWNRLISAATESNLVLFAYDGRHRCVKRVEIQNGVGRTTIMIWGHEPSQGWGLLEERGPNGELLARHVHGPSVDDLVLSELNGAVYYYHQDHLNSTIALTDASGSVIEQYRYDVFGQPFFYSPDGAPRAESAIGIRFLFTGREWLSSLALYDYRHRAYSPSLGRFVQMDPLGFAAREGNQYIYSGNRVGHYADPFGLRKVLLHFFHNLAPHVLTDRVKQMTEEIFRRAFRKYANKKNCFEVQFTYMGRQPEVLGFVGDEVRFFLTRNDDLVVTPHGIVIARQAGWVTEINVCKIATDSVDLRVDPSAALAVTIAHETGWHGILDGTFVQLWAVVSGYKGHPHRSGFVDSWEPPATAEADFSPEAGTAIMKRLGLR
jgi:RHS repeat-associated protein